MAGRLAIVAAFAAGLALDFDFAAWGRTGPLSAAEARVGRPMTPVSAAGVARRTTRRVVRRTTIYIAALPVGCTTVVINGASYHSCGGVYYEPYGAQYVVVDVQ
ncbi:MAG: hypothetical protein EA355_15295 [Rhodobacteraceae bacterium]|nr:MAG: hypothetical protein EA355_15295 [Paracoccaceae bacterium]